MPTPLVECIPNFSDARRPEVISAIVSAITAVPGVHILDRHSDMDHNRTVLTFVGSPAAVEEAAYQSIARAAELIDMDQHTGEHPRLGATDVVPFVPISDITMQDCVEIARRLGKRVGDTLQIPVYLYEEAATRPERTNLENIRRGQYEVIKEEMGIKPERNPDFGPCKMGKAGATVIGARQPLIAFNIYLTTSDVSIAQKIAKALRNSSGGLRFVKAMGILVDGMAQVSMNLTNYRQTPIHRVMEMARIEAARYGVTVRFSELVGLIPQEALTNAAVWYTQMDKFQPDQVLETRLYELLRNTAPETAGEKQPDFIDELASANPTPGGGSAAAHTGAAAAALASMVARVTMGKKKYESVKEQMWAVLEKTESLRAELIAAVDKDAEAFNAVMAAFKLPKDTPEQETARTQAIEDATFLAAQSPLEMARKIVAVMEQLVQVAALGNLNALSDAGTGIALARAALTGAGLNIRTNLGGVQNQSSAAPMLAELDAIEARARELEEAVRQSLKERANLSMMS